MFNGSVDFHADVRGNGLSFPKLDFDPKQPNVDHVLIEGPNGREIESTVFLKSVDSADIGKQVAEVTHAAILDRLSFFYDVSIGEGRITGTNFSPVNNVPGAVSATTGHMMMLVQGATPVRNVEPAGAKANLESPPIPGSRYFAFFRSALQSISPVETFMHLYNVLMMVLHDDQEAVDKFIVTEEPTVVQSPSARRSKKVIIETVYTRLRNEFAHARTGVDINATKQEMANHASNLAGLVKKAIVQST